MNFLIGKLRLPVIIYTGTHLIGAKSWAACEKELAAVTFADMAPRDDIEANAEAFSMYPEQMVISARTLKNGRQR